MLGLGVTGIAILASLLQVFLLPSARAQSTGVAASPSAVPPSSSDNNYTSPGVYPARMYPIARIRG